VLIQRAVVQTMPCYESVKHRVEWHIQHQYSILSAQRSNIVNMGVINENENEVGGMTRILQGLEKYKPAFPDNSKLPIVLWGDGLSALRTATTMELHSGSRDHSEKLQDFYPGVGHWHNEVLLHDKMYHKGFSDYSSTRDSINLAFLRNFYRHTQAKKSPKKSFNASKWLLQFHYHSYAAALACHRLNINSTKDIPEGFPKNENQIFASLQEVSSYIQEFAWHNVEKAISLGNITALDARGPQNRRAITGLSPHCFSIRISSNDQPRPPGQLMVLPR